MLVVFPKDVSKAHSGEWGKAGEQGRRISPLLLFGYAHGKPAPRPSASFQCPINEVTTKKY
ncbi:hypothetical protein [Nostoc sp.]|uniref:hypothetical protein n=1 Tax=Nostoc sp. TaxID=1180 RepID=UPI002FFC14E0